MASHRGPEIFPSTSRWRSAGISVAGTVHRGDRDIEGYVGDGQGSRCSRDRQDVGVVLQVRGQNQGHNLGLTPPAAREQGADGPIDHSRSERLFLVGPALPFEEAARDFSRRIGVFTVIHREGKKIHAGSFPAVGSGRDQHNRVSQPNEDRTVRLLGDLSHLQGEGLVAYDSLFADTQIMTSSACLGASGRNRDSGSAEVQALAFESLGGTRRRPAPEHFGLRSVREERAWALRESRATSNDQNTRRTTTFE